MWTRFRIQVMFLLERTGTPRYKRLRFFQRRPWLYSAKAQAFYFACFLVLGVIITLIVYYSEPPTDPTCMTYSLFAATLSLGSFAVVLIAAGLYFHWKVADIHLIRQELWIIMGFGLPALIMWGLSTHMNWSGGYGPGLYSSLMQIISLCATIYMPLFGSWYVERKLDIRKQEFQVGETRKSSLD